jgi:hypothetical protein
MKKQSTDITMSATEKKIADLKALLALEEARLAEEQKQNRFNWFIGSVSDVIQIISEYEDVREDPDFKVTKWGDIRSNDGTELSFGDGWEIKNIHVEGGGEGDGEEYYAILELSRHGNVLKYFKIPGWYASYDGGTLELCSVFEVKPVERLVTFWE